MIPFNKPFLTGNELIYIEDAVKSGKISGDGIYTKKCHQFFETRYGFNKCLLTTSCTDALEMAAILIDIKPGDEVIMPSFTFVSTANAFVLRSAKIVFADSQPGHPNMDPDKVEELITSKTKAIVVVHYAGIACDMETYRQLADKYKLFLIEDAAQAVDSFYKNSPLGGLSDLAAFSFHETKNIISGEGGMLVINNNNFISRAEIIREKGTNRSSFFRGEVDKYGWVDVGSSFLPSEIIAAFLFGQLENIDKIQAKRKSLWDKYYTGLSGLQDKGFISLPVVPEFATNNAHMFYIVCQSETERSALIAYLKELAIYPVFHYLSLHKSAFYASQHDGRELVNSDRFMNTLLRLPLYYDLTSGEINQVISSINNFFNKV